MTDYVALQQVVSGLNQGDRLVLQPANGQLQGVQGSREHKHKFVLFSARKSADNTRISAENRVMAETVRQALVNRYGSEGRKIFTKVFGEVSGSDVTVSKMRKAFAMGDALERKIAATTVRESFLGMDADATANSKRQSLRMLGLAPGLVSDIAVRARMLLAEQPNDPPALARQNEALRDMVARVNGATSRIGDRIGEQLAKPSLNGQEQQRRARDLLEGLALIKEALDERIASNSAQLKANPFRLGNVRGGFENLYDGARLVVGELISQCEQQGRPVPQELLTYAAGLKDRRARLFTYTNPNGELVKLSDEMIVAREQFQSFSRLRKDLKRELQSLASIVRPPIMTKAQIASQFERNRAAVLNRGSWDVITRKVDVVGYGEHHQMTSTIKPVKHLEYSGRRIGEINGVSSEDSYGSHAVNLAVTSLADENGRTVFTGVRHGVNSAYGIENDAERLEANKSRATDVVLAALESKPELLRSALGGETVTLPIVSTALLSPADAIRRTEQQYLNEQTQAWRAICNAQGICEIPVDDGHGGTVVLRVKPKVITFNYGVNFLTHTAPGRLISLGGGWRVCEQMNNPALGQLREAIRTYVHENNVTPRELEVINTLFDQVVRLHDSEAYRNGNIDPFAMPARIAVLAYKIGMTPCFNCKSGKDRTSQMDVAVKTLITAIEAGHVPEIVPGEAQKNLTKQFLFNGGNFELQQYSTGLAGYKVEYVSRKGLVGKISEVSGLSQFFVDEEEVRRFQGGGPST